MRLAVFTPLNPARCGVSDYSEALLPHLGKHARITVFVDGDPASFSAPGTSLCRASEFRPEEFDAAVYHIGNNPHHSFCYEAALQHPGVTVLHEPNLHHLVADVTIRRGDWDGYLSELEYNGGKKALEYGRRVRNLEVGPDYDGVAMNRRLVESSLGLIVHSRFVAGETVRVSPDKPIEVIPHGAAIPEINRNEYRAQLGLDESTPLIGIFGFLKPYKRIEQALRALRRLVRAEPRARMILVGEEHPDLPLRRLISDLELDKYVRVLGYVPLEELDQWIGTADICLNLRYPTAGETSGTLLRSLAAGRPVIVSDVGAFSELPDSICLKVEIAETEVDLLTEYLRLLVVQPEIARALGTRAREYVATECAWPKVAQRHVDWIEKVISGQAPVYKSPSGQEIPKKSSPASTAVHNGQARRERREQLKAYIRGFSQQSPEQASYTEQHIGRFVRTLEITPRGKAADRVLEMGAYLNVTPALHTQLGYGEVRGTYLGRRGGSNHKQVVSATGEVFECDIDLFDAERDEFPYPAGHFATVLCCELLEHLYDDPMHMMAEINRILRPRGHLVLTTPNICSLRAIGASMMAYHPGLFHQYIRPSAQGETDPRHAREYAPRDIQVLLESSGFEVKLLETGPYEETRSRTNEWVRVMLRKYQMSDQLRDDAIFAVGVKKGPVRERYPRPLYAGGDD